MKKVKQWFLGILLSAFGGYNCLIVYGMYTSFVGMMETTGEKFVANFVLFVLCLLITLFMPYLMFCAIKDGVKQEFK